MLESIFFITLGICCVLLMMLIYHFKQRLSKVEQSNETMFEILNNMVHELSELKRMYNFGGVNIEPSVVVDDRIRVSLDDDDDSVDNSSLPELIPIQTVESCDDSDDDSSEDSGEDSCEDSCEDSDDDSIVVSCNTIDDVKMVNVEIDDSLDSIELMDEHSDSDIIDGEEVELEAVELNTSQVDSIQINKVDNAENLEEIDLPSVKSVISDNSREVYKKMNVASLKALVIEKGLITDPSKFKKLELLELLETQ
jgi:hypothetical protein